MKHKNYLIHAVLASGVLIMPLAYADTTVNGINTSTSGAFVPPLITSAAGNIQVTPTGQVSGGGVDAIQVDSDSATISLDANNINVGGIAVTATGAGIGVNITTGTNASVVVQSGTAINTNLGGDAIKIAADGAIINNSGTIVSQRSAIEVVTGGTNANITNQVGGKIQGTTGAQQTIIISDVGSTINNQGTIFATPSLAALIYNASFNQLINTATGIFDGVTVPTTGNTINLNTAATGTVQNSGMIKILNGGGSALTTGGLFTGSITNNPGAFIQTEGTATAVTISSPITSLLNAGTIQATVNNGTALVITAGATSGTINNAGGSILSQNTTTVQIGGSITQLINSGTIQANGAGVRPIAATAAGITLTGGIVNSGNITTTVNTGTAAIDLKSAGANVNIPLVQNGGIIKGDVLLDTFGNPLNGIVFLMTGGTITGNVTAAGATSDTLTISGGTISGTTSLWNFNDTLNLSGGVIGPVVGGAGNDTYNISGGSLSSLTDTGGVNILNLSKGLVTGNISFVGSGPADILNLSGGIVQGTTTLGNLGDTVNLSGTSLQALNGGAGADTFNVSGGSFTSLDGKAGADILNVTATFTSTGPISAIETINVKNVGTVFTVDDDISGMTTQLTTGIGTRIVFNTDIPNLGGGAIQNNGGFQVNDGFTVTNLGAFTSNGRVTLFPQSVLQLASFTQNPSGSYAVGIQNPFNGQIQTTGNATLGGGSTVNPFLTPGAFLAAGTTFDIIKAAPAGVLDGSTLVQPSSPIIFFTKSGLLGVPCGANSCVRLTSERNPYTFAALSDVAIAVAATLDGIVPLFPNINPDILAAMGQLDFLSSAQAVTSALEMLAPGFNYAMIAGTHVIMKTTFDSLQHRLEDLKGLHPASTSADYKYRRDEMLYNGVDVEEAYESIEFHRGLNFGDIGDIYGSKRTVGAWVKVNGDFLNQKTRNNIAGFQGEGTGLAIGADYKTSECSTIGAALSIMKEDVHDITEQRNTVDVESFLTTFYGWFEPIESFFIDSMLGIAAHKYSTTRNMAFGTLAQSATANFYGLEYGAQMDLGYAFLSSENFYSAPFVRLKYTYLTIDNYTETGAGGLDLAVKNQSLDEAIAGAGVKFAIRKDFVTAIYIPEFSALVLYDFSGQAQEMQANFLGGGNPFYITGIKPAQTILLFGLGINAHTSDNYTFTLRNTLEVRDHFLGYDIYAQLQYTWD